MTDLSARRPCSRSKTKKIPSYRRNSTPHHAARDPPAIGGYFSPRKGEIQGRPNGIGVAEGGLSRGKSGGEQSLRQTSGVRGGEGGIRTLGTLARSTVFETAPIDHSGTSPWPARTIQRTTAPDKTVDRGSGAGPEDPGFRRRPPGSAFRRGARTPPEEIEVAAVLGLEHLATRRGMLLALAVVGALQVGHFAWKWPAAVGGLREGLAIRDGDAAQMRASRWLATHYDRGRVLVADPVTVVWLLVPLLLLYAVNYALAFGLGRWMLLRGDAIALTYGTVMRNLSIALALAMNLFGSEGAEAALLIALAYVVQVQSAAWSVRLADRAFGPRPA